MHNKAQVKYVRSSAHTKNTVFRKQPLLLIEDGEEGADGEMEQEDAGSAGAAGASVPPIVNDGKERTFRARIGDFVPNGNAAVFERLMDHIRERGEFEYLVKSFERWGVASMEVVGHDGVELDDDGKLEISYDANLGELRVDFKDNIVITHVVRKIIKEEWQAGDIIKPNHINQKVCEANWAIEWHFIQHSRIGKGTKRPNGEIAFTENLKKLGLVEWIEGSKPVIFRVLP